MNTSAVCIWLRRAYARELRGLFEALKAFPIPIQTVQTDNGTVFTYKYISKTEKCPFDTALETAGIAHKLIPPRTPWHNGKVERSYRNDQRYFYDWEMVTSIRDLNDKLEIHLSWSNNKAMRTLGWVSPLGRLDAFPGSYH